MAFPSDFLDELRARTSLEAIISRKVKLTKRGREFSGLCPFHNEKTPSFTVVEEKGFYHCFGCGAHGDVIRFLMEDEGLPFHEAVKKLADQAGLPLPEYTKADIEAEKKRASLNEIMEKAADWFIARLNSDEGKEAREYIKSRGLSHETVQRFSLGFAPERKTALKEALMSRGIPEKDLIACGLLIEPEDKRDTFDRFRNRLMFPILDGRGRTIAFGGRALDDAPAKYLNSPETRLFHKGRNLYNLSGARKSAFEKGQIIVVEGYMDVIALSEFGFENTVAPLGTAVTEDQIRLLWRLADEPILCFDGDAAGYKAALRTLERTLPDLQPGKSLQFALLPKGEDPDTLVRQEGKETFEKLLEKSNSLADLLWKHLTEKAAIRTPEQKAGLEKKVFATINQIKDTKIKTHYRKDFGTRLFSLFRSEKQPSPSLKNKLFTSRARTSSLLQTPIGRGKGEERVGDPLEEVIILCVINHPNLAVNNFEEFSSLSFLNLEMKTFQKVILEFFQFEKDPESKSLKDFIFSHGLEKSFSKLREKSNYKNVKISKPDTEFELAEKWWKKRIESLQQVNQYTHDLIALTADLEKEHNSQKWDQMVFIRNELGKLIKNDEFLREYDLDSMAKNTI